MQIGVIKIRELTTSDVSFSLECLTEDDPIEGNASAIDEATDRETETWIREQLSAGNEWAWCTVKVVCSWEGFHAAEYLGCCSYESEASFRASEYEQMCDEALTSLNRQIAETVATLHKLAEP